MNKFTLSVFTVSCVLGLTACSGGGSSDHTIPPTEDAKTPGTSAMPPPGNSATPGASTMPPQGNSATPGTSTMPPPGTSTMPPPGNSATPNNPQTGGTSPTPPPPNSANPQTGGTSPTPPPGNSQIGGYALTTNKTDASDIKRYVISNGSMDKITIEGKTIDLTSPGRDLNGFTHIPYSAAEYAGVGKQFSYLRFGIYTNWIGHPQGVLPAYNFVVGHITPDSGVPGNGTASYKGNAYVSPGGSEGWFHSYSSFDVDFGNKTINGRLDYNGKDADNILLSGNIQGASFSGVRDGVTMQGHFYGPQAAELGGTFGGPITRGGVVTNASGSFGASKQ